MARNGLCCQRGNNPNSLLQITLSEWLLHHLVTALVTGATRILGTGLLFDKPLPTEWGDPQGHYCSDPLTRLTVNPCREQHFLPLELRYKVCKRNKAVADTQITLILINFLAS